MTRVFFSARLFWETVQVRKPVLSPDVLILNQSQLKTFQPWEQSFASQRWETGRFLPQAENRRMRKVRTNRKEGRCLNGKAYNFLGSGTATNARKQKSSLSSGLCVSKPDSRGMASLNFPAVLTWTLLCLHLKQPLFGPVQQMMKVKHSFEVSTATMAYPRWISGSMCMVWAQYILCYYVTCNVILEI